MESDSPTFEKVKKIPGILLSKHETMVIKLLCLEIDELKRRVDGSSSYHCDEDGWAKAKGVAMVNNIRNEIK